MTDTTTNLSGAIDLGRETLLHLPDGLALQALGVDSSYWEHASSRPELADGRVLSVFAYGETWDWWERHPFGDEFVYLLSGDVDMLLDDGESERAVPLTPGQGAIIPIGAWHRAVVRAPSRMLFVTPTPGHTEHRDA